MSDIFFVCFLVGWWLKNLPFVRLGFNCSVHCVGPQTTPPIHPSNRWFNEDRSQSEIRQLSSLSFLELGLAKTGANLALESRTSAPWAALRPLNQSDLNNQVQIPFPLKSLPDHSLAIFKLSIHILKDIGRCR